jgi:Ribonuclease G/E
MQLIRRVAAAEKAHGEDDDETLRLAKQLDLRRCPECSTIIEKNEGCSSMVCYLCGHQFRWSDAERVKKKQKKKTAETADFPDGIPEGDTSRVSLLRPTTPSTSDSDEERQEEERFERFGWSGNDAHTLVRPAAVAERSCVVM